MMSPEASQEGTGDALPTKPANWAAHGHAKLLYPLLTALNVALLLLLYYYLRRIFCSKRPPRGASGAAAGATDSNSGDSSPEASPSASVHRARLDPAALSALPLFVQVAGGGEGEAAEANSECAVCLGELAPGETGRLLPRCGHRFHAVCVDVWFRSHSTCPICRSAVVAAASAVEPKSLGSDEAV